MLSHLTIFGFLGFSLYKRNWKKNYAKGSLAAAIALLLAAPETFSPLKKFEKKESSRTEVLKNQEFLAGSSFSNKKNTFSFSKNKEKIARNNSFEQDSIKSAGFDLKKDSSYKNTSFSPNNTQSAVFENKQDLLKMFFNPVKEFFLKNFSTSKKEVPNMVPSLNIRQPPQEVKIVEKEVEVPVYIEQPQKTFIQNQNFAIPKTEIDLSPFERFIINRAKVGAFYESKDFSKRDLKESFFRSEDTNDFGLKNTGVKEISWNKFFQLKEPVGKINSSIAFWNNSFETIDLILEKIEKGEKYDLVLDDLINNKFGFDLFASEKESFKNFLVQKDKNVLIKELQQVKKDIVSPNLLRKLEKQVNLDPNLAILREKYKDTGVIIKNESTHLTNLKINPDFKDLEILENVKENNNQIEWKLPWSIKNNLKILRESLPENKKAEYNELFKEIEGIKDKNVFEKNKKNYKNLLNNIFKKLKKEKFEELNVKKNNESEVVFLAKKKMGTAEDLVL